MTPLQLFLVSLFIYLIFNKLSDEKTINVFKNNIIVLIIYAIFFISFLSIIVSVIWGIFYYIKI